MRHAVLGLMLALVGCASNERAPSSRADSGPRDAGIVQDAGPSDSGSTDAGSTDAGSTDAGSTDAGASDAGGLTKFCESECQTLTAAVVLNSETATFEKAFYGLSVSASAPGVAQLYVEASRAGGAGCPTEASPTPEWLMVVSSIPLPLSPEPVTEGLSVTFVDFSGRLLMGSPISRATTSQVQLNSAQVCLECVGMPAPSQPDGHVALDVMATFPEGSATGHIYATHCDSLDTMED